MNPIKKTTQRKAVAKKIIRRRMLYAAGLGLVPIPILDAAAILSTQVLMIKDIAKTYRVPFKGQLVKSLIGSLVGSLGTTGVIKAIPGLGTVIGAAAMSLTGIAATYAIGKIFTLHFEQGGTLLDFDPVKSRKYFEQAYREGELRAAAMKDANKSRLGQIFQSKSNKSILNIPTNKPAETASQQKIYQEAIKKARRRKALRAKKRRKAGFKKLISRLLILGILGVVFNLFYSKYIAPRFGNRDALQSNEIDLFLRENAAKQVKLSPSTQLDSLSQVKIASFSPISSEGAINQYIQDPAAIYPKRYSLNTVRFKGSSEKISSGAKEQLANIALLMKKYPDLLVNIYGQTGRKGPVFDRQRIGRDRARVLTEVFIEQGIPSYRITGNYIEKEGDLNDGYWGAEIVLYVATIESVVEIAPPSLDIKDNVISSISKIIKNTKEDVPVEEDRKATTPDEDVKQAAPVAQSPKQEEEVIITSLIEDSSVLLTEIDTQQMLENADTNQELTEALPTPPQDTQKDSKPKPVPVPAPPAPAPKKTTIDGVMQQYIESPKAKYPKIFSLNEVSFKKEVTEVNGAGKAQLAKIATLMKKYPKMHVKINGHTAAKATVDTKEEKEQFLIKWQGIGQKRARAIKKILHDEGIANKRIKTGFGLQNRGEDTKFWGADLVIERN